MRIGLDLDETISALPAFFSVISQALVAAGHEVHVITYREPGTEDGVRAELAGHGIAFTDVHLPARGDLPAPWKASVAGRLGLELMFEDSPENLAAMPPGVGRMWLVDPEVFDLDHIVAGL